MGDSSASIFQYAYLLKGDQSGTELDFSQVQEVWESQSPAWLHIDFEDPLTQKWLYEKSGIEESLIPYLITAESRPGLMVHGETLVFNIRTLNPNEKEEPEDMVSIRICISQNRILTLNRRKTTILGEMASDLEQYKGARNAADFLQHIIAKNIDELGVFIDQIDEYIGEQESQMIFGTMTEALEDTQFQLMNLRRFLLPQKNMLNRLVSAETPSWIGIRALNQLRTHNELHTRFSEDVEYCWQRIQLIRQQLNMIQTDQLNQKLYLLAIVSCVFLPLTLLTGWFGVNLQGIPLAQNPAGFYILSGILVVSGVSVFLVLKARKWF